MSRSVKPTPSAWQPTAELLQAGVTGGLFAGCAVYVSINLRPVFRWHTGRAELRPRDRLLRADHPFDLASLTKVLCTTPLALALVDRGLLDLDAPVTTLVPDAPPGVTPRHLLLHASGLPAWNRVWAQVEAAGLAWGSGAARQRASRIARRTPLEAAPGAQHRYSDLGFLTLGAVLEAAGGDRLDRLWERWVREPVGADLRWGWPDAAATEDCPVRERVIVGEVHDLNAATMGGIAPHAGLFGPAAEVARLGEAWLSAWHGAPGGFLPQRLVREAWSAEGPGSHKLGWDGVTVGASSAGPRWPRDGVGHLGFTGCSLWIAPRQRVVAVLLTNRVHPEIAGGAVPGAPDSDRYAAFRALRPALHTAVVEALEAEGLWT